MSNQSFRLLPLIVLMPASFTLASEPVQPAAAVATLPATLPVTVVTASRIAQPIDQVIGDISVIERAELERYSGESVLDALQMQASIQIISNGGAGKPSAVFMRGANTSHTLVLIDGVRYGSITLGTPALEHLPVDQIERIEILRGSAASLYGSDAIGGVIQIFTRQGSKTPSVSLTVGAGTENTQQASVTAGGQFGETRAAMTIAHSKTDGISAISNPSNSNFFADEDSYQNNSISLNLTQNLGTQHQVGARLLVAEGENQFDGAAYDANFSPVAQNYDYRNTTQNGAFSVWSRHQWSDHLTTQLQIGRSEDKSDNFSPQSSTNYADDISVFDTAQTQFSLNNELRFAYGSMTFGAERLEQKLNSSTNYPVKERSIDSFVAGYVGQYKNINVQANLRNDDNSQYGNETTYGVGFSAAINEQFSVGAQHSTAFLAPSFNDLYFPFYGDASLAPEQSNSREVFIALKLADLRSRLTAYQNDVKDLIEYNPATFGPANIGQARLQGVTLNNDWQLDNLQAGLSYDYLDAEDRSNAANRGNQLRYRAKHSGVAYFGMQQDQLSGRVELQAVGTRYTNPSNTQQVAGYTLVNLSGSVEVTPELKIGLRVNNLFDEQYESIKDYGTLGTNGLLSLTFTPKL
ncbi:MAG: TonB-dependent receptor [Moraxellaceae bacterium]